MNMEYLRLPLKCHTQLIECYGFINFIKHNFYVGGSKFNS